LLGNESANMVPWKWILENQPVTGRRFHGYRIFLIGIVGCGVQLAGEIEVLGGNLPQCRFVHHKPHMMPGREPGPSKWEARD
jgi:hypothetical protein